MEKTTETTEEILIDGGEAIVVPEPIKAEHLQGLTHSKTIGEIAGALAKAQGAMSGVGKGKQGYGYKYADLAALVDVIRIPASENGLSYLQGHRFNRGSTASVTTETLLMHESGEWIMTKFDGIITPAKGQSPIQSEGVAMTYGRRYMLQSIFGIAAEEDTDGK